MSPQDQHYVRPVFDRGAGFANRLFPYGRAILYSRQTGAVLIEPRWFVLRRGPLFRDKKPLGGVPLRSVVGKLWLLDNLRRERAPRTQADAVRIVSGNGNYFADLAGGHAAIHQHLNRRASKTVLKELAAHQVAPIVLNVRLARDFRLPSVPGDYRSEGALRSPLSFYEAGLARARGALGDQPAAIVSDGTDYELAPLLALPGVTRFRSTRALSDLLFMARASYIIGTGGSSFSAWGAFLAQCPVVTIEGQSLAWFKLDEATSANVVTIAV